MDIEAIIRALSGDHADFEIFVSHVKDIQVDGLPRVNLNFYQIAFADGKCAQQALAIVLKNAIVRYCIKREDRLDVLSKIKDEASKNLAADEFMKARGMFIKAKKIQRKTGEPGELLLYLILNQIRKAPQIVSKMYLKTARNMPVHGSDGLHIKWDGAKSEMVTYFGESKLYKCPKKAASKAVESLAEMLLDEDKKRREIELLTDHSDFGVEDKELIDYVKTYLNPYANHPNVLKRREVCAVFIGYDSKAMPNPKEIHEDIVSMFMEGYIEEGKVISDKFRQTISEILPEANFEIFVLPFESVIRFRNQFYDALHMDSDIFELTDEELKELEEEIAE